MNGRARRRSRRAALRVVTIASKIPPVRQGSVEVSPVRELGALNTRTEEGSWRAPSKLETSSDGIAYGKTPRSLPI